MLGIPYSIAPVPVATPRHAWCAEGCGVPRAALNEHAKDCDFQPNTNCDACYLWRQMDGHTTKGQVCFETGSDRNHLKVRRHMVGMRTVPHCTCRAGGPYSDEAQSYMHAHAGIAASVRLRAV